MVKPEKKFCFLEKGEKVFSYKKTFSVSQCSKRPIDPLYVVSSTTNQALFIEIIESSPFCMHA